ADDVLRMTAASFGLEYENAPKATLLNRLEAHFLSRHRAGYHALLIIDEAQNLPFESIEELRMLSNFYSGKHALIQIFLLGQDQFRDRLYSKNMEQLRQRVVASCHLEPLSRVESTEYIKYRLKRVGWQDDPQITDRAFARIHSVTKGVPRRINTFCDRLFLFGFLDGLHQLKDEHVKAVAKELMYEVSAKDVKLSDIKPEEDHFEKSDSTVDTASLDSEQLAGFSDDAPEKTVIEKTPPAELTQTLDSKPKPHEPKTLRVVNGSNTAMESYASVTAAGDNICARPDWWEPVVLAVDYFYNPLKYNELSNCNEPLPNGVTEILKVAVGKTVISSQMRIDELAEVSDETLHQACANFIQKVWLADKADYYRRLGVKFDASLEDIRTQYRYLFRLLQTEQGAGKDGKDETYIRRINQAFSALRSEKKRKEYDEFLLSVKTYKKEQAIESGISTEESSDIEQDDLEERSSEKKAGSSPRKIGVLLVLFLFAGAGGVYYLQPDMNAMKSKLAAIFQEKSTEVNALSMSDGNKLDFDREQFSRAPGSIVKQPTEKLSTDGSTPEIKENKQETALAEAKAQTSPIQEMLPVSKTIKPTTEKKSVVAEPKRLKKVDSVAVIDKPVKRIPDKKTQKSGRSTVSAKTSKLEKPLKTSKPAPKKRKTGKSVVTKKRKKQPVVNSKKTAVVNQTKKNTPSVKTTKPVKVAKLSSKSSNTPPAPKPGISDKALVSLTERFSQLYEEGKLDKFMSLFSKDVLANNDENWDNIRKDYKSLFRSTEMRVIELNSMRWDKKTDTASGRANFVVTVLRQGGDEIRKFEGKIRLKVKKVDGKLLIYGMYHTYGEDES
ncbi:MAG TPA: hypothetical protein ENK06_02315, partial [Gammaproteobacteria bacterium]|nr:hypothetical protein [Gammaproteobacteria bacterium]